MADLITIKEWLKWLLWLLGAAILGVLLIVWHSWYEARFGAGRQGFLLAVTVTCSLTVLWLVVFLFHHSTRRLLALNTFINRFGRVSRSLYWIMLSGIVCGLVGYASYNYFTLEGDEFALLKMGVVSELEARIEANPELLSQRETPDGPSLLAAAFQSEDIDMVEMLLNHGAVFCAGDNNGRSPISIALRNIPMLKTLLEGGVSPDLAGADGVPPLHQAITQQSTNAVSLLLESGANINAVDQEGRTALMRAMESCDLAIASNLLFQSAVNINARDRRGDTVLHKTVRCNQPAGIRMLLEKGADPKMLNYAGFSPLHIAAICGKKPAVQALLKVEGAVLLCNKDDQTALDYALKGRKYKVASLLLDGGAEIDRIKRNGQTILHSSIQSGDYKAARFLIEHGARIDIPDAGGMTARNLIHQKKIKELLALIDANDDGLSSFTSIDPSAMLP